VAKENKNEHMNILEKFAPIKLFVLDVDGVLTDGSVTLLENGEMARTMNVKDGYAMQLALKKGYEILIISGGTSEAVKHRLAKLGINNIELGIKNKVAVYTNFLATTKFTKEQILYMGDDVPDVAPMLLAGLACAPSDAVQEVLEISNYISPKIGGKGCVRDVIEKVLKLNGHWSAEEIASI
jgi:3-deoxy-D-manno-octulosonate 8-phosphate phosphatase (KDO 8-P phosphatase)